MSTDRWMDKEVMVYIHNGILLSHKKSESVLGRWMNLEPVIQSEVKKRKTTSYINAYINVWNPEKQYW